HAVLIRAGDSAVTDLDAASESTASHALGTNGRGVIVGYVRQGTLDHAALFHEDRAAQPLPVVPGVTADDGGHSYARRVNDEGMIVGQALVAPPSTLPVTVGIMWEPSVHFPTNILDLVPDGSIQGQLRFANAVNRSGQILVSSWLFDLRSQLLTPP